MAWNNLELLFIFTLNIFQILLRLGRFMPPDQLAYILLAVSRKPHVFAHFRCDCLASCVQLFQFRLSISILYSLCWSKTDGEIVRSRGERERERVWAGPSLGSGGGSEWRINVANQRASFNEFNFLSIFFSLSSFCFWQVG